MRASRTRPHARPHRRHHVDSTSARLCDRALPRAERGEWRPQPRHAEPGGGFILADPELRAAAAHWARLVDSDEATTAPPRRLPCDPAYRRIRDYLQSIMDQPVFTRPRQAPPD